MKYVKPSAAMAALIEKTAHETEDYVLGPVSAALGSVFEFSRTLYRDQRPAVRAFVASDSFPREALGAALKDVKRFADVIAALTSGKYELAAWSRENSDGNPGAPVIGVVSRNAIRTLGFFPIVPVLVVVAVGAALTGAWVLADLYLSARAAEARAHEAIALADARFEDAIRTAKSEEERAQLINALQAAHQSAAAVPPGWIQSAGAKLAHLASDFVNAQSTILRNFAEDVWPWAFLIAWLLYAQRKGHRV
jgi:hypothetical protein